VTEWLIYGSRDGITWPVVGSYIYAVNGTSTSQGVSCTDDTKWGGVKVQKDYAYLRVAAQNAAGVGAYSSSLRWRCSSPPDAPAAPTKVSGTSSSITIAYAPLGLNDAIPMGYKISYDDGLNGNFNEVHVAQTWQTQYTAPGLVTGRNYRFGVKVVSEIGDSPLSTVASFDCGADADPPSAPVYVSSRLNNELTVGWSFPGSNGGSAIQEWFVYLSNTFADNSWSLQNAPSYRISVGTMQAVIDCTNVRGYNLAQQWVYVKVAARTGAGVGLYSPISKIFCSNRPDPPSVADDSGTSSSATIRFVEGNLYGSELKSFKIYMDDGLGGGISYLTIIEDTSQRHFTATGLVTGREYLVQVTVVSGTFESVPSTTLGVRACSRPDVPAAPTRKASTSTRITLQWTAPASNGCPLTGYRLYMDDNNDGNADVEIYPGTGDATDPLDLALNPTVLEFEKTGMNTGFTYGFKLRAYNARGSTYSALTRIRQSAEPRQMTPPTQLTMASSETSIAIAWVVPDLQGGTAVGYKVYRNNGGASQISATPDATCGMEYNPAPQRCTLTGLTPGFDYLIQMVTVNDVGESPRSDTATLKAATVPATINTLVNSAASNSPASLSFTWTSPADNGATIYNYRGELHKIDDGSVQVWNGLGTTNSPYTSTSLTLTEPSYGLVANKQYKFRVRGENVMDLGVWSSWTSLTDPPRGFTLAPPQVPPNFGRHSDPPAAGAVKLGWDLFTVTAQTGGDAVSSVTYEVWGGQSTLVQLSMIDDRNNYHSQAVPAGDTWYFKVRAKNSGGTTSPFTATLAMISAELPNMPPLNAVTSTTAGQVVMSWDVPAPTNYTGAGILRYEVSNNNFVSLHQVSNTLTTYTFTGQSQSAQLTYSVRSVNSVGHSLSDSRTICVAPGPCPR